MSNLLHHWRSVSSAHWRRSHWRSVAAKSSPVAGSIAWHPVVASCLFASEYVESVYHVQHGVAVDGVVFHVAAAHGRHCAREVALVGENVVELQRYGERLAAQESL